MSGKTVVLLSGISNGVSPTPAARQIETTNGISNPDNIFQLLGLVFILIMILIAAYYTSKFVGKMSLGQFKNSNFKVIDTYRISPNKFIQIVKIANKYIVLAVGKDNINYITELDESEVLTKDDNAKENMNFKQILEKIKNKEN
jgi:flagellar protein FliO/FliZ